MVNEIDEGLFNQWCLGIRKKSSSELTQQERNLSELAFLKDQEVLRDLLGEKKLELPHKYFHIDSVKEERQLLKYYETD